MLEKIYSVKNVGGYHKLYTILGMKFKVFTNSICIDKEYKKFVDNLPVQNNKILFHSNTNSYSCNPKYIAEEILKRKLPYELVWVVNNLNKKNKHTQHQKYGLIMTEKNRIYSYIKKVNKYIYKLGTVLLELKRLDLKE